MEEYNLFRIAEEAERVLNTTTDIIVIDAVVKAFEDIKGDEKYTNRFLLPLPLYDYERVITTLEVATNYYRIKRMLDVCLDTEEYEMCSRIEKIINKIKWSIL